ncbi:MAG: hypothetical protein U5L08_16550 [Xanthomonadales bacterium]|nr:hypothetical protein [Xanthomonadales bacterium]
MQKLASNHSSRANPIRDCFARRTMSFLSPAAISLSLAIASAAEAQTEDEQGNIVITEEGGFCFACYSEEAARFKSLLDDMKGIQKEYQGMENPSKNLERFDDFRISRTGMLIHEECFEPGRFGFDVEQAVVDGLVKTFSKFIELEKDEIENWTGEPTQIILGHVPDFVNLYDPNNWEESNSITYEYRAKNGDLIHGAENETDPCSDLRSFANRYQVDMRQSCRFPNHIERGRPKIFCAAGEAEEISVEKLEGTNAYASNPTKPRPLLKNYNGQTSIYQEPFIVFNDDRTRDFSSKRFQSALTHEHFHNFGWEDFAQSHNSYSYYCQVAVFYNSVHEDVLTSDDHVNGIEGCINSNYDPDSPRHAAEIGNRIASDKD